MKQAQARRWSQAILSAAVACVLVGAAAAVGADDSTAAPGQSGEAQSKHPKIKKGAAARTRDALAVDAGIAVKEAPAPEIVLPGVMRIAGASSAALDPSRAKIVPMTNGGTETVYLSATEPNRIQLPFTNPKVIANTDVDVDKSAKSNNVYVTFVNSARPVQMFIEAPDGGAVQGLQLVPKSISSQTIIVVDETRAGQQARMNQRVPSSSYIARVQDLMGMVALGRMPDGCSGAQLVLPPIAMNGLMVRPAHRLSCRSGDIFEYEVMNATPRTVRLEEEEFDGESVTAVSVYPRPLLAPGEKTEVFVMARPIGEQ